MPCYICGDPDNHHGDYHSRVMGDGLVRADVDAAKADHQRCLDVWADLDPLTRSGTTFHGWEAHLARRP